jgi:monoamine oxidase
VSLTLSHGFFPMARDHSVIIVGAGIAGLAAASLLSFSGCAVTILEARDRIGGRIFTLRDPYLNFPIELGAEFIHGLPPAILDPLHRAQAKITEVKGQTWCFQNGELCRCDASEMDVVLSKMDASEPDESFLAFVERHFPDQRIDPATRQAKTRALSYITGFEAADPGLVGVHWLVRSMRAEDQIQGERTFRSEHGYEDLVHFFNQRIDASGKGSIHTNAVVHAVNWRKGSAEVSVHTRQGASSFEAPKLLLTLPLAVMKAGFGEAGSIRFTPALPREKFDAMEKLETGKVIRVVFRFHDRFWENIVPRGEPGHTLSDMSFLFSENEWFPTWWTAMPSRSPTLTAWAPFRSAENLSGQHSSFIVPHGIDALSSLLEVSKQTVEGNLQAVYLHDWQADPFSRGAYSYGKAGSDGAHEVLASPIDDTVYFAGEATDTSAHNGTVHGAIASGYRAAMEILQAFA